MTAQFSDADRTFMQLALNEARAALDAGDYPVGAALVVDGELWGAGRNALFTQARTAAHAEHALIDKLSNRLRSRLRTKPIPQTTLYTTLEPCLMCLGISVMHRIDRIVIACPDLHGGVCSLNPAQLGSFYPDIWPQLEMGLLQTESVQLILQFLERQADAGAAKQMISWKNMLVAFNEVAEGEDHAS